MFRGRARQASSLDLEVSDPDLRIHGIGADEPWADAQGITIGNINGDGGADLGDDSAALLADCGGGRNGYGPDLTDAHAPSRQGPETGAAARFSPCSSGCRASERSPATPRSVGQEQLSLPSADAAPDR